MPPFMKMAFPIVGGILLSASFIAVPWAQAQNSPQPVVSEEIHRARDDFATGGIRRLSANWFACTDEARGSQDANQAERCIVYGDTALLLGDAEATQTPWMRHLTPDIVAQGQAEMLTIMGIPAATQAGWLDRYQSWISQANARNGDAQPISGPTNDAPNRISRANDDDLDAGRGRDTSRGGQEFGGRPDLTADGQRARRRPISQGQRWVNTPGNSWPGQRSPTCCARSWALRDSRG